jgi:predicted lactoylglutathione lyase
VVQRPARLPPAGLGISRHRVNDLIPFVHVEDVQRSVDFYEKLGFEVRNTHHVGERFVWAMLVSGGAQLMVALASAPIDSGVQAVLFYVYAEDLEGLQHLREDLLRHGLEVGQIAEGNPAPSYQMRLNDPDGYCLMIAVR